MVNLHIETLGNERIIRGFNRFTEYMKDLRVPFKRMLKHFYQIEEENFKVEGKPKTFTPLKEKYRDWKSRHYPGKTIMRLKDNLYKALTGKTGFDSSLMKQVKKIGRSNAEFGVICSYAEKHQKEGSRMVVQLTNDMKVTWTKWVHKHANAKYKVAMKG